MISTSATISSAISAFSVAHGQPPFPLPNSGMMPKRRRKPRPRGSFTLGSRGARTRPEASGRLLDALGVIGLGCG
jgi:hypothetical protein